MGQKRWNTKLTPPKNQQSKLTNTKQKGRREKKDRLGGITKAVPQKSTFPKSE